MKTYYQKRAPVYDNVYQYPERQTDLRFLEEYIARQFSGLNILEIAAGTGYWTQFIAKHASSILSTDITPETLEQLKKRKLPGNVSICESDAYNLNHLPNNFNGAFAGLWLSHVPKQRLRDFLFGLHSKLQPGSTVLFVDNSRAQCVRLPISRFDEYGNSFQQRELGNGSSYEILKNFPAEFELMKLTEDLGFERRYIQLDNYWLFRYQIK